MLNKGKKFHTSIDGFHAIFMSYCTEITNTTQTSVGLLTHDLWVNHQHFPWKLLTEQKFLQILIIMTFTLGLQPSLCTLHNITSDTPRLVLIPQAGIQNDTAFLVLGRF